MVEGPYCNGCVNQPFGIRRVCTDGLGSSKIMLVGDSPWTSEIAAGRNFAGAAGSYLERMIRRLGMTRDQFIVANSMWCKPPHLGWTDHPERYPDAAASLHQCRPYLDEVITRFSPAVVIAMGNVALQRLCGVSDIENRHAYVHDSSYGIPVVPTFHPSFVMQGNHKYSAAVFFAFSRAREVAAGAWRSTQFDLKLDGTVAELTEYLADPIAELMVDIETPETWKLDEEEAEDAATNTIVRVGVSTGAGHAATVPWAHPFDSIIRDAIGRAATVLFWNKSFDLPRLVAAGARVHGRIIDAMWAWHFLQSDLPKALGFVAPFYYAGSSWKHLSAAEPAFYNAMDAAVQMLCWQGIRNDLQKQGRFDRFLRHCAQADPILVRMGDAGLLVNAGAQQQFKARLETEVAAKVAELQQAVPDSIKPVRSYKRKPKDLTNVHDVSGFAAPGEAQFVRVLPFNPESPKQVAALAQHFGIKLKSTEAKFLKRYERKNPIFKLIRQCREQKTMLSTFIWQLGSDNRVHTTYGFHPSTWRKSSRNVNLQNIPKRSDLAIEFRCMLVAGGGRVLIEADASAIEAMLVGYAAGSQQYIELARRGVHKWLAEQYSGHAVAKTDSLYDRIKRVVHLSNYKGTPERIYEEFPEEFASVKVARELQEFYFSTDPGKDVVQWQNNTMERAHSENVLRNHFDYIHYFYNVFAWDSKYEKWRLGEDAKRAVAFVPQSDASAIQTEVLLRLAEDEEMLSWLRLIIHDSIVLEVPEQHVDRAAKMLYNEMVRPIQELQNLSIGCEVSAGPSLGEMRVLQCSSI